MEMYSIVSLFPLGKLLFANSDYSKVARNFQGR